MSKALRYTGISCYHDNNLNTVIYYFYLSKFSNIEILINRNNIVRYTEIKHGIQLTRVVVYVLENLERLLNVKNVGQTLKQKKYI